MTVTITPPQRTTRGTWASNVARATFDTRPANGKEARAAIIAELARLGLPKLAGSIHKPVNAAGTRYLVCIDTHNASA